MSWTSRITSFKRLANVLLVKKFFFQISTTSILFAMSTNFKDPSCVSENLVATERERELHLCGISICELPGLVTWPVFWYGRAADVPGLHPIHILGEVKKQTHSYTLHSENCTHSYTNFQILPIHILFWLKSYPIDILMIPIYILEGLKSIPHPAACLYIPL